MRTLLGLGFEMEIEEAKSVNASLRLLHQSSPYDLVILDMSLPTFDVGPRESGGRPEGFGGREIMHYIFNSSPHTPVLVVTQFEKFGEGSNEVDLLTLTGQLQNDFPGMMRSLIYYNAASDKWMQELECVIKELQLNLQEPQP